MAVEIERKFLVADAGWRADVCASAKIVQGYIARGSNSVVRVRTVESDGGGRAFLTIKSTSPGLVREEFEYEIPAEDARQLLSACEARIEKTRHELEFGGLVWSVDEFHAALSGFVLAEIELSSEEQVFSMPAWAGREVTDDADYRNESLARRSAPPAP